MQKKPLVSLVITTFNRREKLKKALDSVVNQTYKNLEIIIGDNHSEDGTEELCREYAAKDPRIKYFRHAENLGMTANGNFVTKQATGEYFYPLCDDDWIDLDYIEKCIDFANTHPDYVLITSATKSYDENYNLLKIIESKKINQNSSCKRIKQYLKNYTTCSCFGIYKMNIIKQMLDLDGVILKERLFEDWVYLTKVLVSGKSAFIENTYFHKLRGGWTKDVESTKKLWNAEDLTNESFWDKLYETLSDAVLNDKFFQPYLDKKTNAKLIKTINRGLIEWKIFNKLYYSNLNPIFFFRNHFWIPVKRKINWAKRQRAEKIANKKVN